MKRLGAITVPALLVFLLCFPGMSSGQKKKEVEKKFTVSSGTTLEANVVGDIGELYIQKGKKEREGSVIIQYNPDLYNYDYYYDEDHGELFVSFKKEKLFKGIKGDKNQSSEMDINLPDAVPTNLDVKIKAGILDLNLSEIPVKNLALDSWAGEATVRFNSLNPVKMEYMKVDVNVGEVRIEGLGNANFEVAFIDGGIGSLYADLSGTYTNGDHFLKIDLDIGEAEIELPENVGIRLSVTKTPLLGHLTMKTRLVKRGRYYYSPDFDDLEAKLYLKIEAGIGECIIR